METYRWWVGSNAPKPSRLSPCQCEVGGISTRRLTLPLNSRHYNCTSRNKRGRGYIPAARVGTLGLWAMIQKQFLQNMLTTDRSCHRSSLMVIYAVSHYSDVIMSAMMSQITSLTIVYSIRRKHQSSGLCAQNSLVTGEFPAQKASNAENVSIWWRHHGDMRWLVWV